MKRDMELVREILRQVEAHPEPRGEVKLSIPGHSENEIAYHVSLLAEAKLLDAIDTSTMKTYGWEPHGLTWEGHEFLNAIKNDTVWGKVKKTIAEKGGSASIEVIKALALQAAKSVFGV